MIHAFALALVLPGLLAPPAAAHAIGVEALDARAKPAALEILRQLASTPGLRALAIEGDPSASDCRAKPYAAAARIETTVVRGVAGWTFDAGLVLVDCAGWNVDQWHSSVTLSREPNVADAERLGMNLSLRLRTWMHLSPELADSLLRTGLAYDPATAKPTYFYTLFKTNDGNMRALVRPGGPAYEAGLRTNDIVERLDGKYWWEYGTYQTEQRAYDGKPHTFEVTRGKAKLTVKLGEPFPP